MAGRPVVIDGCSGSGKSSLARALRAHRPLLVRLTCSWDEARRRTLARGDRTLEEAGHGFKTSGLHLVADCELDTTQRTPAELAEALAPFLESAGHDDWERGLARPGH